MPKLIRFIPLVLFFAITTLAFSQPSNRPSNPAGSGGSGGPAGGGPSNPRGVPIDGGIGVLLVAGGIIGARKMYKNFKEDID